MAFKNFYGPEYDLAVRPRRAKTVYMVASVPRSGSTHFLRQLWARGVFGTPLEYLNPQMNERILHRLGGSNLSIYWKNIQKLRSTSNGVFGFKMFVGNYTSLINEYPQLVEQITPHKIIYYTRGDKVAQAVSYARAVMTNRWFAQAKEKQTPIYDFNAIYAMEKSIRIQEAKWERLFIQAEAEPLRVEYSEVIKSEDRVMTLIAEHLGVSLDPSAAVDIGEMEKQGDGLNKEWAARYAAEKITFGAPDPAFSHEVLAIRGPILSTMSMVSPNDRRVSL